ncbi:MAG: hypothetical protein N3A65_06965 [candidate division WOR-3 bacterium]|nr:hypothetical protein [candidate division WOR-3 bacterium]
MGKYYKTIVLIITVLIASLDGARPFGTDDAGTVSAGGYELELGYDIWKETGSLCLGFKHGLTAKMDIGIGFGFNVISEPKNSFLPSELVLKYSLVPDLLAASFTSEIGRTAYTLNGIFTRVLGPVEFDANLGYSTGDSSIIYASALIYSKGKFALGGEVTGNKESHNWLVGGRYIIKEGFMLDAGFTSDFKFEEKIATTGLHYEF